MLTRIPSFKQLSDPDLLREVRCLAAREREATAHLIASLAELDARRLYLAEGCSSVFTYCVQVLRLSEHAAYDRIEVARATRRFRVILTALAAGEVTLTSIRLLAPHLTEENHQSLLAEARHRTRREVEQIVSRLQPRPDVPSTVRKLPTQPPTLQTERPPLSDGSANAAQANISAATSHPMVPSSAGPSSPLVSTPTQPAVIAPLAPARYKVSFTITADTYAKLQEAQALLRHVIPSGDPALIFDRALTLLVADCARTKYAATNRPRPPRPSTAPDRRPPGRARHIPAEVKRTVWARDGGQCAFVSTAGLQCVERAFLEFHHVVPYARGGRASIDNIELRCKRHNGYEAARDFGPRPGHVRETAPVFGFPLRGTRFETSAAQLLCQVPAPLGRNSTEPLIAPAHQPRRSTSDASPRRGCVHGMMVRCVAEMQT